MARTEVRGGQVKDASIQRADLDTATSGSAVVAKIIAGTNITLGSTGADAGTGDVTVNAPNVVKTGSGTAAQYVSTRSTITYGATTAVDWVNGNVQTIVLTGNWAPSAFSNPLSGGRYLLEIKQSGAGSFTVTWPSSVKWSGATAPTLTTTTGQTDIITLYYNGTNYAASSALNFTL